MKRFIFTLSMVFLLALTGTLYSQNISLGVAAKASTTGLGGDVVVQFHERMSARVGFDHMGFSMPFEFEQDGIDFRADAAIKTGSFLALYDFYISKIVFATAGLGWNNFNINAIGSAIDDMPYGDITVPKEKVGSFEFDLKPSMRISPYIGIGFGRTLNTEKRVGFAFELGTFYQGGPDISIVSDGLLAPTSNPVHGQETRFEEQLRQYSLYPVLKFNLSVRIVNL